jgi:hypothetical protein
MAALAASGISASAAPRDTLTDAQLKALDQKPFD